MARFNFGPQHGHRLRLGLGFAILLALVTGLFMRADEVSPEAHYAYMQSLRRIQQADVELNAAAVASYADLLQNYDPLLRRVQAICSEQSQLTRIPSSLSTISQARLRLMVGKLLASQQAKEDDIDRFQRSNAILRNSEFYLPHATETLLTTLAAPDARAFEHFVRHLLGFTRGGNPDVAEHLTAEIKHFRQLNIQRHGPLTMNQLLVHAELIIAHRPEVNALVERIMHSSAAALHEEVTRVYIEGHEQALRLAGYYSQLLYLVSLLLAAYVIYALFRIEDDRRQLADAHRDLAERYEAQRRAGPGRGRAAPLCHGVYQCCRGDDDYRCQFPNCCGQPGFFGNFRLRDGRCHRADTGRRAQYLPLLLVRDQYRFAERTAARK